jgi:hypothetical protein
MLPDFGKHNFPSFRSMQCGNYFEQQIYDGCLRHINSDKYFHSSAFFVEQLRLVKLHMSVIPFTNELTRKWFIAHILMELMLDRTMCKLFPDKLNDYYNDLQKIEEGIIHSFFDQNKAINFDTFWPHFEHFRSIQYIRYYVDNNKLVYSLNRIMQRVGLKALNEIDTVLMMNLIEAIEKDYFASANSILPDIRAIFI